MAVTVWVNRAPEPQPGGRLSYREWRALKRRTRERDGLIRTLLARGVPPEVIAEAIR